MPNLKSKTSLKTKTRLTTSAPLRKKTKLSKTPKLKVSKLKKKADKVFSQYVRLRDGNKCITCATTTGMIQAGHFMSRRYNATRYDEENTNAQCYRCNVMFYGEQYKYAQEIDLKYGEGTAQKLSKMAHQSHPFTIDELQQIIQDSQTQINFLKAEHVLP